MQSVVTLSGSSAEPRLSPEEIDALARFAYAIHNHEASRPQQPIFWMRVDDDLSRFWN